MFDEVQDYYAVEHLEPSAMQMYVASENGQAWALRGLETWETAIEIGAGRHPALRLGTRFKTFVASDLHGWIGQADSRVVCAGHRLPFRIGGADLLVALGVVTHCFSETHLHETLIEWRRAIKPNGVAIVGTYFDSLASSAGFTMRRGAQRLDGRKVPCLLAGLTDWMNALDVGLGGIDPPRFVHPDGTAHDSPYCAGCHFIVVRSRMG